MCFPFGVGLQIGEDGRPSLESIDPTHTASKIMCGRCSVLYMCGEDAAREVAFRGGLDVGEVMELGRSPGKSCAHVDSNDTGAGPRTHGHVPFGSKRLEGGYIFGDEGLPDGSHAGEDLWHMVMIISYKMSATETQSILGIDPGDASLIFEQPSSEGGLDDYRIVLYAVDYSLYLHGNTNTTFQCMSDTPIAKDAWAMRCTPYATSHACTWGRIISEMDPTHAASLLSSLAELPGSLVLGSRASGQLHPWEPRQGRLAPPKCSLREGTWAAMYDVHSGELVSEGFVDRSWGTPYVGGVAFAAGEHRVEEVELRARKRGVKRV